MASDPNNPNPEIPTIPIPEFPIPVQEIPSNVPEIRATDTEISMTVAGKKSEAESSSKSVKSGVVGEKFEAGSSSKSGVEGNKKKLKSDKGGSLMGILRKTITCGASNQEYSDENEETSEENDPHNTEADDNPNEGWGLEQGSMHVLRYVNQNMVIGFQDVLNSLDIFPRDYADWNALARATLLFWRVMNPDVPIFPVVENATPSNCWPGSVTIFGKVTMDGQNASFERLNWTDHNFEEVRANINCLIAIQI